MEQKQVCAALVKAQKAFGPALKSSSNPHFKSRYADLAACIEAVIDGLNSNGIALIQKQHPHEGGVSVETIFIHESGEQLSAGILTVPAAKQDPQGYGSALTYARRYSLMAACGIAPEDDDGNAASKPRKVQDNPERAEWLSTQKRLIMDAPNVGKLRRILSEGAAAAQHENDSAAVDQLNAWADEKRAQAKPKAAA